MKSMFIKVFALALLALGMVTLTGCNTTHGFGEDLEATGQEIQEGAK